MTTYQPDDLILVAFPFVRGAQAKQRAALIIFDPGDADVVAERGRLVRDWGRDMVAPEPSIKR